MTYRGLTKHQAAILARCVNPTEDTRPEKWHTLFAMRDARTLEALERRGLVTRLPEVPQGGRLTAAGAQVVAAEGVTPA